MSEALTKDAGIVPPTLGWRFWIPRMASAIVAPIVLLLMIEGGLRLAGVGFPTSVTVPCTLRGQPGSCYNLFFPAPFFPPGMIKAPETYAIPAVKGPNTFRIFVLGESAAMGDPDPAYGFSRYLEVMLRESFPGTRFEIANTGSVAINSHVLLPIAKGLAEFKPDAVIIYSGNNEVVGPYGPGTVLSTSAMSLPVIRSAIFMRSTRTGQLLNRLGTRKREWGGMEMFLDKQVPANSPLMQQAYENYEANLRDTIAAARQSGARIFVSTVATNLRDCAPFASLHRENFTAEDLGRWTALVERGASLEASKSYAEALQAYESALAIDDQYAELEFRIARTLLAMGKHSKATSHFSRTRDLDTLRFRADSRINEINRASSAWGAELVDAESILATASPDGIIGNELIYEHVHLTPRANYLLAREFFSRISSQLSARGIQRAAAPDSVPSEADCERWLALTPHDRLRMNQEMMQRLQKPPFTNQINHSEQVLKLTMLAEMAEENPQDTAAEYQWAIGRHPEDRILHYNFGLFLFNFNRGAAANELRLSRPWDDFPVFAPDGTLL